MTDTYPLAAQRSKLLGLMMLVALLASHQGCRRCAAGGCAV